MSFRSALRAEPVLATQIIITRKCLRRKIGGMVASSGCKFPELRDFLTVSMQNSWHFVEPAPKIIL